MPLMMMGRAARGMVAGVILLAAGVVALGCAAGEPGGNGSGLLPAATDLPTATHLPVAAPLPAATGLPTYAVSPTATPLPTATIVFTPRELPAHSRTQIRLMDRLDARPDFYCLDVPGFGDNIQPDAPLQAHTCKWDADDQLFDELNPSGGFIEKYMEESWLCVTASEMTAGATLLLDECHFAAEPRAEQWFRFRDNPRPAILISLHTENAGELCVGVAASPGEPAGGRNHLRRDLTVYECDAADPSLVTWIFREDGARIN